MRHPVFKFVILTVLVLATLAQNVNAQKSKPEQGTTPDIAPLQRSLESNKELDKDTKIYHCWLKHLEQRLKKQSNLEKLPDFPNSPKVTCAFGLDWNYRRTDPAIIETSGSPEADRAALLTVQNTYVWPLVTACPSKQRFFLVNFENDEKYPIRVSLIEPDTQMHDTLMQKAEFKKAHCCCHHN